METRRPAGAAAPSPAAPARPDREAPQRSATAPTTAAVSTAAAKPAAVDLDRYVPAFLTWIANKLSRGASQQYLSAFGVGIETWRCLVLLAIEGSISAQRVSRIIGMDKSSVSRCFKSMQARGLITLGLDAADGRLRIATLTEEGRALHDRILDLALERERVFLSVLDEAERETLIALLKRLHDNLPAVEAAARRHDTKRSPGRGATRIEEMNDE